MGMFDRLVVPCPECGEKVEFQSKAGHCNLDSFNLANVPTVIALDLKGEIETCVGCAHSCQVFTQIISVCTVA